MPFFSSRCTGIVLAHPAEHVVRDAADVQRRVERVEIERRSEAGSGGHRVFSWQSDADVSGTRGRAREPRAPRRAARRPSGWGRCSTSTPITALRIARDDRGVVQRRARRDTASRSQSASASSNASAVSSSGCEDVVVAVDRLGEQRPPQVFVGGHADEEVVEQRAEPVLDACRRGLRGRATPREVGRPGGARSRPGAGRASTGSSGTASPRCRPQARGHRPHARAAARRSRAMRPRVASRMRSRWSGIGQPTLSNVRLGSDTQSERELPCSSRIE